MTHVSLPDKLSELLEAAILDLEKAQADGLQINMSQWHASLPDGCHVCLAGALLRGSGVPDDRDCFPHDFGEDVERKLAAVNCLREGRILDACSYMKIAASGVRDRTVPYWTDNEPFYRAMVDLVIYLEGLGL